MKILTFECPVLEQHYLLPRGSLQFLNVVVDNEIANDLSPDWDYTQAKLICTGFLHRDGIEIYMAESEDDNDFRIVVMDRLLALAEKSYLYSFNANMEQGNFKGYLDLVIPFHEVKPFKAKGWNKERFYTALVEDRVIPNVKIFDPLGGDGGKVIAEWQSFLIDKDTNHLMRIGFHNLSCLIKEVLILRHKDHFLNVYNIDKNGFMLNKK